MLIIMFNMQRNGNTFTLHHFRPDCIFPKLTNVSILSKKKKIIIDMCDILVSILRQTTT